MWESVVTNHGLWAAISIVVGAAALSIFTGALCASPPMMAFVSRLTVEEFRKEYLWLKKTLIGISLIAATVSYWLAFREIIHPQDAAIGWFLVNCWTVSNYRTTRFHHYV